MKRTESSSRKGDLAEYYAVTWLWDNGYEVFQNAGCSGPVDIVAMDKKGEIILIDVKTARVKDPKLKDPSFVNGVKSNGSRTKQQKKLGVIFLLFNPLNRKLRFVNHEPLNQVTNKKEGDEKNEEKSINVG